MGVLGDDTAVEPVVGEPGRFRHKLSRDWQVWGPNGGYIASVALRAAGVSTPLPRPANLSCLFLGMASYDDKYVDIEVTSLRRSSRADALRVCISQNGKAVLEGHIWAVADALAGLEHDVTQPPDVPHHTTLKSFAELQPDEGPNHFWSNFDGKPIDWIPPEEWPPAPPVAPSSLQWMRYNPVPLYPDDPWIDACRAVILLDTYQWPAAHRAHLHRGPDEPAFIAPNMDQSIHFHRAAPQSEWLLIEAHGPVASGGLMGCESRVWSDDGRLVASANSHLMCREVPRGTVGSGTSAG
ncbi:MAG TPA: thioesterase family protein [Acidimicrobiales bacterium]|nr:thioesterase family protein [Acidimicrobiales bacterium]